MNCCRSVALLPFGADADSDGYRIGNWDCHIKITQSFFVTAVGVVCTNQSNGEQQQQKNAIFFFATLVLGVIGSTIELSGTVRSAHRSALFSSLYEMCAFTKSSLGFGDTSFFAPQFSTEELQLLQLDRVSGICRQNVFASVKLWFPHCLALA